MTSPNLDKELIAAIKEGKFEKIKFFIEQGADLHARDEYQLTPLHWAARVGNIEALDYLLNINSKTFLLNQNNNTPLHSAAYGNQPQSIIKLLSFNADIHAINKDGDTPLHSAAWKGNALAIEILAEHLADLERKNNEGDTALHLAAWNNNLEALHVLIKKLTQVDTTNNDGDTALHLTVKKGHVESFLLLVCFDADLTIRNHLSQTIFDLPEWNASLKEQINDYIVHLANIIIDNSNRFNLFASSCVNTPFSDNSNFLTFRKIISDSQLLTLQKLKLIIKNLDLKTIVNPLYEIPPEITLLHNI